MTPYGKGYEAGCKQGFVWGSLGTAFIVFMLVVAARFFGSVIMGWA